MRSDEAVTGNRTSRFRRDWRSFLEADLSTKAQTLSALVSAVALVVIAAQYVDNHRLLILQQRQTYMAVRAAETGNPQITAFSTSVRLPVASSSDGTTVLTVYLRNTGRATASDVTVSIAPDFGRANESPQSQSWETIVPGEPFEADLAIPLPLITAGKGMTVRASFRRMSDGPNDPKIETCTRFRYSDRQREFVASSDCK